MSEREGGRKERKERGGGREKGRESRGEGKKIRRGRARHGERWKKERGGEGSRRTKRNIVAVKKNGHQTSKEELAINNILLFLVETANVGKTSSRATHLTTTTQPTYTSQPMPQILPWV